MGYPAYTEYSVSVNQWIGSVPSHWNFLRADFITSSNKLQVSTAEMENVQVFHYSIPNIQEFGTAQIEDGNDIDSSKLQIVEKQLLISKLNPRKATICIAEPHEDFLTVCSGEFVPIVPEGNLCLRYCYYAWLSDKVTKLLSSMVQSVTRSHQRVSPNDIRKLPWAWPPATEQQKIADFLDWKTGQIDKLIAKKKQLIEKLKEKRIALITYAVTKGLDPNAPMRDSGIPWLGEVPGHWDVGQLRRIITLQRGVDITKDEQEDGKVPVVSSGGISSYHSTALMKGPGVLVGRKGTAGAVHFIDSDYWPHDTTLYVKDFFGNHPRFVYYLLSSMDLKHFDIGSSNPTVNRNHVHPEKVAWPKFDEQRFIANSLDTITNRIDRIVDKLIEVISSLNEYRTALITAATTGKIDVRNVKIGDSASS